MMYTLELGSTIYLPFGDDIEVSIVIVFLTEELKYPWLRCVVSKMEIEECSTSGEW